MYIPVRSASENGKLLFKWDPCDDTIEIIRKGEKVSIKLVKQGKSGTYSILERRQKVKT